MSVHCLTGTSGGMQRQEDGYSRLKLVILIGQCLSDNYVWCHAEA